VSKYKSLTNLQLITCIVERGKADDVVKAAREAGAPAATIFYARGTGIRERLAPLLKIAISQEKEVIYVLVSESLVDTVFDAMVDAGELELPARGIIFVTQVLRATTHLGSQSAAQ
jgi:nitrogen regulatory protein P-II 1